ncbi:hypothetical protein TTHERM_00713410 (macronuclear) [Tetrahymena thermophila SB210]|uniref:RNA recognition motif protein n=1 Tax=Tetrahymena thermophila (strain SB210) TaxID=312017 RepID=Q24CW1_TETTS|nr:hypothetical protein TTHERM_00713410 [Tetrahymena thermophila SB210]EAS05647.1 hypothetical protein TTHERM_00713410 [Tetrahymena thermophila SB210]|eukprot:XP_001025892.1 hypothetical protein TTHERM_00713410 [Tetrahymena thermophila SB210]
MEISHGNNCILKIQKGGTIKEVTILQNEHIFIVDNLPLNVKEQDVINLFEEYGEAVTVTVIVELVKCNSQQIEEISLVKLDSIECQSEQWSSTFFFATLYCNSFLIKVILENF